MAGGGFLFVLSLLDYSVPSLFHVNVYALEIFAEYSASHQPARAFLLSVPLLAVATIVLFFSQSAFRNAVLSPPWRRRSWTVAPALPAWAVRLQRAACAILMAQITVPLVSLILMAGSWQNVVLTTSSARQETGFTIWIATLAAFACLPLGLAVANELAEPTKRGRLWWVLATGPLAVPAPLIGIGLIAIWNQPVVHSIYGSGVIPVLAALARFTPLAAIVLLAQLRRVDPALVDAAEDITDRPGANLAESQTPFVGAGPARSSLHRLCAERRRAGGHPACGASRPGHSDHAHLQLSALRRLRHCRRALPADDCCGHGFWRTRSRGRRRMVSSSEPLRKDDD